MLAQPGNAVTSGGSLLPTIRCLLPWSRFSSAAISGCFMRRAKSPRCQISSSGPTVAFQLATIASFIVATDANGRR